MRSVSAIQALSGFLLFNNVAALPFQKRSEAGPVITTDFPDPSIIQVGDTWYAFGTQSVFDNTNIRVQVATSTDFQSWSLQDGMDALGSLPAWVESSSPQVWAPDVFQRDDGTFVMYFSAATNTDGSGKYHCVGIATSDTVTGPYTPTSDTPFVCPTDQGGAIDASAFSDEDGTRYILYKIDANSVGNGGTCGNTVEPILSTPIMIQQVQEDGVTPVGSPTQILTNGQYDGPLVEAPSMMRSGDGTYILFFSSNCYTSTSYDVSYATASSPTGPFTKATYPLFVSGPESLLGPGGADIDLDGTLMAFHGYMSEDTVGQRRGMYVATVTVGGDTVSF